MKRRTILAVLLSAGILAAFLYGLSALRTGQRQEGRRQLEEAVRRAAVACYAAEGAYPANLEVLIDRFGIQIGRNYEVIYEVQGANLMPNIIILERMS